MKNPKSPPGGSICIFFPAGTIRFGSPSRCGHHSASRSPSWRSTASIFKFHFELRLLGKALSNWGMDLSFKHIQIITRVIIGELVKVKSFFPMSLDVTDSLCHVPCFSRSALGHLQAQTKLQKCYFSWAQARQILT